MSEFGTQPSLRNRLCCLLLPSAVPSPSSAEKTLKPRGKEIKPMFEIEPHIWGKPAIGSETLTALEQPRGFSVWEFFHTSGVPCQAMGVMHEQRSAWA